LGFSVLLSSVLNSKERSFYGYRSVGKEGGGDAGLCSSWVRKDGGEGGDATGLGLRHGAFNWECGCFWGVEGKWYTRAGF